MTRYNYQIQEFLYPEDNYLIVSETMLLIGYVHLYVRRKNERHLVGIFYYFDGLDLFAPVMMN